MVSFRILQNEFRLLRVTGIFSLNEPRARRPINTNTAAAIAQQLPRSGLVHRVFGAGKKVLFGFIGLY
jgi:hypothetical protein